MNRTVPLNLPRSYKVDSARFTHLVSLLVSAQEELQQTYLNSEIINVVKNA